MAFGMIDKEWNRIDNDSKRETLISLGSLKKLDINGAVKKNKAESRNPRSIENEKMD